MISNNCIFCKISSGEIPSFKIWEDEDFLAILDVFPNRKGMTLVLPKAHCDSDITKVDNIILSKGIIAVKQVELMLKKGFNIDRVGMIVEGLQVNHLHFKLYPFFEDMSFENGVNNGPRANDNDLILIRDQIINNSRQNV